MFLKLRYLLHRLASGERGQGMAEYGLILALIAIAVIAALTLMGTNLSDLFNSIAGSLGGSSGS